MVAVATIRLRAALLAALAAPAAPAALVGCAARLDDAELGAEALTRGDDAGAIRHLRDAVKDAPDNGRAWSDLARAHFRLAQIPEAALAIDQAARLRPEAPEVVLLRAQIRLNGGDRDGAQRDATWVLAHGDTPGQLQQTAVVLVRLGRAHDALAAASRVVELSSGSASSYGNLAVLALELRETKVAARALRDGRARHPHDVTLAQTQAAFFLATGDHAQARVIYEELIERHPNPGLLHHALALLAHEAGDLDDAQRHADAAVAALGQPRAEVVYTQIIVLRDRGRIEDAQRALARARRRFPAHEGLQELERDLAPASR
jgi:tetratricopeptide (TPR) repeat protein